MLSMVSSSSTALSVSFAPSDSGSCGAFSASSFASSAPSITARMSLRISSGAEAPS